MEDKKAIWLKTGVYNMTFDEVHKQFEHLIYSRIRNWKQHEIDELVQIAMIGLWKAYERYDIEKGVMFMTYAVKCIDSELLHYNRGQKKYDTVSLNNVFRGHDDDIEYIDIIADETDYEDETIRKLDFERVRKAIEKLTQTEQGILRDYFYNDMKQSEISKKYGIAQSHVSRHVRKYIPQKLRKLIS